MITATASRAAIRIIRTDEELTIARWALLPGEALITDQRLIMMNHTGGWSRRAHVSVRRT